MLVAHPQNSDSTMAVPDKAFYQRLGRRIAERRKAQGITQVELAKTLGIAQQTMAHYEAGNLRTPAALLPTAARALGCSIAELVGEQQRPGKRGPAPKLQQQLERITQLPKSKQKFVMDMLDTVLKQAS